jgi:hypothetical protein
VEKVKEVIGGTVRGDMWYDLPAGEALPGEDPGFFFTAYSAWCPFARSGELTVELRRPEIKKCEWLDGEGNGTGKGLVGETLKMSASFNGDAKEGAGVTFRVYKEGADTKKDRPEYEVGANVKDGKAEAGWAYHYKHDPENPLKEKPKYFFTANSPRCKEAESGDAEMGMNFRIYVKEKGEKITNTACEVTLSDGSAENVKTDGDGLTVLEDKVPGVVLGIKYEGDGGGMIQNTVPLKNGGI